ncbi:hypothetical protein [Cobetia marina]|uniref:hypothetical protein n=1 Tax=Cobetia marina TaxID=28258 RepID=UPI003A90182F
MILNKYLRSLMGLATFLLVLGMSVSLLQAAYNGYVENGATMAAALGVLPRLLAMVSVWVAGSVMWKTVSIPADDWADDSKRAKHLSSQRTLVWLSFTFAMAGVLSMYLLTAPDISETATQSIMEK